MLAEVTWFRPPDFTAASLHDSHLNIIEFSIPPTDAAGTGSFGMIVLCLRLQYLLHDGTRHGVSELDRIVLQLIKEDGSTLRGTASAIEFFPNLKGYFLNLLLDFLANCHPWLPSLPILNLPARIRS
jgi:hypothetical protein